MNKLLIFFQVIFFSLNAFCIKEVTNGGFAVQQNDQLYLLDLYESDQIDLELKDLFLYSVQPSVKIGRLPSTEIARIEFIIALNLIKSLDSNFPLLSRVLLKSLEDLEWKFSHQELSRSNDIGIPTNHNYVQVAIQSNFEVTIHLDSWKKLRFVDRVALIVHEIIYSLKGPDILQSGQFAVDSKSVRQIVADLFYFWRGQKIDLNQIEKIILQHLSKDIFVLYRKKCFLYNCSEYISCNLLKPQNTDRSTLLDKLCHKSSLNLNQPSLIVELVKARHFTTRGFLAYFSPVIHVENRSF
jgi:hypothetical protein